MESMAPTQPNPSYHWHLVLVGTVLVGLSFDFLRRFALPAKRLSQELDHAITALKILRDTAKGPVIDLNEIASSAMTGPSLSHPWREFAKTLHAQRADDQLG